MASQQFLEQLYRTLYTIRVFETQCIRLYRQGLIVGYFHPYLGEEAIATGVCAALREDDYIVSTHRGHGHCHARGASLAESEEAKQEHYNKMMAELCGRATGYCMGRGGSMHIADVEKGNLGATGIVGGNIPVATGAALAQQMLSTIMLDDAMKERFALDRAVPALRVEGATFCGKEMILEMEDSVYRGDMYRFSVRARPE